MRATPLDSNTPSTAELIHGRTIETTLPTMIQPPWNSEVASASLQYRCDFCRYDTQVKEGSTLLPTQPVWVQDSTSHRGSQGVVKSKAETPRSYTVETPQGEYKRSRICLKEAAMNTTVPASTPSVVPKVHIKSIHQHTQDVQSEPITPTQDSPDNNKGNYYVSVQCVPNPQSAKVVERLKPRNQGHPDHINPTGTT